MLHGPVFEMSRRKNFNTCRTTSHLCEVSHSLRMLNGFADQKARANHKASQRATVAHR